MQMYGTFDENGRVNGFYSDDVYPPDEDGNINPGIPAGAIPLDEETYKKVFEYQDQWRLVNGEIVPYTVPPLTLAEQRQSASPLDRLTFRTRMKAAGVPTATIEAYLADIADPDHADDMAMFWEDSQSFKRLDAFIVELGAYAKLTDGQIDTVFKIGN